MDHIVHTYIYHTLVYYVGVFGYAIATALGVGVAGVLRAITARAMHM